MVHLGLSVHVLVKIVADLGHGGRIKVGFGGRNVTFAYGHGVVDCV